MRGWRVLAWSAALLTGVLGAPAPLVSDEIGSADAPWFNMTGCHHPSKTIAQNHGVHDPEHAGMTLCQLTVTICGDLVVERHQSINPDTERCPASLKFTTYPSRPVCCERWQSG